jgi:molybdopterin-containing oxidoreductase family iron-sulfur binding subunit
VAPFDHRLFDGRGAHLPILQEIGHGLTTIAWDSWVAINPNTAQRLGLKRNDVVKVEGPNGSFEAAVFPLPGVHKDAVVVPRGNGHTNEASTISKGVGVNPLVAFEAKFDAVTGHAVTIASGVKLVSTGKVYRLAAMQKHADIGNRLDIVKKMSLKTAQERQNKTVDLDTVPDLYPKLEEAEHRWGMAVDLEKCTGCGACMVACSLENNIPQVGRDQILMGREMHWIRLDRYYAGDVDNPEVSFQPVMCQQCNHAPCEAVCPVFATVHDPEGINAMVYNRCVGTRYCANACPYKVRRYNWWTHKWNEIGKREVDRNPRALNPDVTVRTRGVMEKCNFCYGRLRDAKHDAKQWNRPVRDGDAKVACQQTCPTDAIIFGNIKDEKSQIFHARKDQRSYAMLGGDPEHKHYGLKTLPNVSYLADVTIHEPITNHGHSSDHGSTAHDKDHG